MAVHCIGGLPYISKNLHKCLKGWFTDKKNKPHKRYSHAESVGLGWFSVIETTDNGVELTFICGAQKNSITTFLQTQQQCVPGKQEKALLHFVLKLRKTKQSELCRQH